jgi:hypothetical protein
MQRKAGTPPSQPLTKQQSASPFQQTHAGKPLQGPQSAAAPSAAPHEPRSDAGPNGGTYYDATTGTSSSSYPPAIGYTDQPGPAAPQTNGSGVGAPYESADSSQYLYAQAPAVSSASVPSVSPVDQPTPSPNPLIAFASHATQHVAGQTGEEWRPHTQLLPHNAGNTWQEWTAAIADRQDRYSANALLTLGSSRPGDLGANTDHVNQGDGLATANPHAGQWPLLLFHDGSGP